MCCQFSNGVSIPILCPLALPNKAVSLESQIGSWLASHFKPTFLLAQLHEPRASNHHRCMKPNKQGPQLACSRSRNTRHAHSLGAIEVGLDASQIASPDRGVGDGVSLDLPSHRILPIGDPGSIQQVERMIVDPRWSKQGLALVSDHGSQKCCQCVG